MKHSIIYLAAGLLSAAAMLTSCDNRLDDDNSGGIRFTAEAVSFSQPGVRTKATPVNTVSAFSDTYTSFSVSAYKGTTARVSNGTVSYSSSAWSLNQTAKWYSNETLDFYALAAPATAPTLSVTPSSNTASFSYAATNPSSTISGANTPDIMFGYYSGTGTLSGNKRVAPLTFYHPFAAIKFKAGADLVGATVNSITIKNVAYSGTCTIAASNLATAGNTAFSWQTNTGLADYGDTYSASITAENQQIGTDSQTFMIIPQTMGETSKLEVNLTVVANGVNKTVTLEASLNNLAFTAGTIHTFTVNFSDIPLDFTEPNAAIIAYVPDEGTHIDDPTLVPKYAYMPTGQAFNDGITGLVNGRAFTKIVFNRFGAVDDDALEIQAASPVGEPIYAQYEDGIVTITTHANTIYLNPDCSHMFEDMATITAIEWGSFFNSNALNNTSYMFKGCSSIQSINLTGVLKTALVTDMSHMFDGCSAVTMISLGLNFGTSNVTDMSYMFRNCSNAVELPAPRSSSVINYSYMYYGCSSLLSIVPPNTSNATNLDYLYYGCSGLREFWGTSSFIISSDDVSGEHMFDGTFDHSQSSSVLQMHVKQETWEWIINPDNHTYINAHGININFI